MTTANGFGRRPVVVFSRGSSLDQETSMRFLNAVLQPVHALFMSRALFVAENLALRKQFTVLLRLKPKQRLRLRARLFWLFLLRVVLQMAVLPCNRQIRNRSQSAGCRLPLVPTLEIRRRTIPRRAVRLFKRSVSQ